MQHNSIIIGRHTVGNSFSPYIIAEIGVNHEGSMHLAKRLIAEAAEGGAHAAKFQSYKAGKLASKHSPAYWDTNKEPTKSQYKLFKKYDNFGQEDYEELAIYCKDCGIDFMSTPFDLEAVDFLNPLVPAFKIASADITNVPLIRKCAQTGKPLLMSTGASTLPEIEFAIQTARQAGASHIAILHCVLNYPTPIEHAQLGMILVLKRTFPDLLIGYSDHVVPDETISSLEVSLLLGASILEKHFTHDKNLPGNDHYHAMNKLDLQRFCAKASRYAKLIGHKRPSIDNEKSARANARRSIVAARSIGKGEIFSEENLTTKRPGLGISPIHWDEVIGRQAAENIDEDSLLSWSAILDEND